MVARPKALLTRADRVTALEVQEVPLFHHLLVVRVGHTRDLALEGPDDIHNLFVLELGDVLVALHEKILSDGIKAQKVQTEALNDLILYPAFSIC